MTSIGRKWTCFNEYKAFIDSKKIIIWIPVSDQSQETVWPRQANARCEMWEATEHFNMTSDKLDASGCTFLRVIATMSLILGKKEVNSNKYWWWVRMWKWLLMVTQIMVLTTHIFWRVRRVVADITVNNTQTLLGCCAWQHHHWPSTILGRCYTGWEFCCVSLWRQFQGSSRVWNHVGDVDCISCLVTGSSSSISNNVPKQLCCMFQAGWFVTHKIIRYRWQPRLRLMSSITPLFCLRSLFITHNFPRLKVPILCS